MEEQINKDVKEYIDHQILPQYKSNIGGHGMDHIRQVIARSFELAKTFQLEVDPSKVYVIAAYHDIGYPIDSDRHEEVSAQMFLADETLARFFSGEERREMAEAIVDHRASLEYEARSIYGKLVSSADREISVRNMLVRSLRFQKDKHKAENPTLEDIITYSYQKLSSKYGNGGYAKMYFEDQKYKDYLAEMRRLFSDEEIFRAEERKIAEEINLLEEGKKELDER